jgi:hypothetical protein
LKLMNSKISLLVWLFKLIVLIESKSEVLEEVVHEYMKNLSANKNNND